MGRRKRIFLLPILVLIESSVAEDGIPPLPQSARRIIQTKMEKPPMAEKLQAGDQAPEFEAVTDTGQRVKLSDYRGKRVVLYFYPKDDTPGCTTQACDFRDRYPAIEERNAVVLGVSPDDEKSHVKFKSKFNLPFTLLVDEDHAIADAYGVWGEKSMYGKTYMGIVRSNFVIDETGKIIKTLYNIKPADSAEEALAALA
jgi:thioredoxin-dependent peroxiredoxin